MPGSASENQPGLRAPDQDGRIQAMHASNLQSYELKFYSTLIQYLSNSSTPFFPLSSPSPTFLPLAPQPSIPILPPYIMSSSPRTTTTTKPTILLIHGAWHTPATWNPLRSALDSSSYPTLPSSNSLVSSHHNDIAIIRHELERLILSESKQVILVCHSYGGMVGSGAVTGLEAYRRKAEEKKGGVVHCLFLCAFLVPIGKGGGGYGG